VQANGRGTEVNSKGVPESNIDDMASFDGSIQPDDRSDVGSTTQVQRVTSTGGNSMFNKKRTGIMSSKSSQRSEGMS